MNLLRRAALIAALLTVSRAASAAPDPKAPYQKLQYLVGKWKIAGDQQKWPLGDLAGKFLGSVTCRAFTGNFHVVCESDAKIGGAVFREMMIFGYDSTTTTYTWFDLDSTGTDLVGKASSTGPTWSYDFAITVDGKPVKIVAVMDQVSATQIHNTATYSIDGAAPTKFLDLTLTKQK